MRYPAAGILGAGGSTNLELEERGRAGNEDFCCLVEEFTERTIGD